MASYEAVQKFLENFSTDDVIIRNRYCVFILSMERAYIHKQENGLDFGGQFTSWYPGKTEWKSMGFNNFDGPKGCFEGLGRKGKLLIVGVNGVVASQTTEAPADFMLEDINIGGPVHHVRNIAGKIYVASSFRHVHRREGVNQWTKLHGYSPAEIKEWKNKGIEKMGFDDIDGSSESDIYACGEAGDLWHYDGAHWRQLDIQTNEDMLCLHYAEDGWVYIGTRKGHVWRGQGHEWKRLKGRSLFGDPINDIVWFKDRLYVAAGALSGLHTVEGDRLVPLKGLASFGMPDPDLVSPRIKEVLELAGGDEAAIDNLGMVSGGEELRISGAHTLSTDGEYLLVAGHEEVLSFDGEKWSTFYGSLPPHGRGKGSSL